MSTSVYSISGNYSLPNLTSKYTQIKVKIYNVESRFSRLIEDVVTVGEDYTQLWNTLRQKVSLVKHDKVCPGQASFGHITGGYDAGYYG